MPLNSITRPPSSKEKLILFCLILPVKAPFEAQGVLMFPNTPDRVPSWKFSWNTPPALPLVPETEDVVTCQLSCSAKRASPPPPARFAESVPPQDTSITARVETAIPHKRNAEHS